MKVEHWDKGRGGLRIKVPEAKDTNAYLEQVKFTITTYYQQLQLAGKEVTVCYGDVDHPVPGQIDHWVS